MLEKDTIRGFINSLELDTWGPTEIIWDDNMHRVHIIVGIGKQEIATDRMNKIVSDNIANNVISEADAKDFMDHLIITEYTQED